MRMFWNKKTYIGVDLGSYSMKVCSLDSSHGSCTVSSHLIHPDRTGKDDNLTAEAWRVRVGQLLKDAIAKAGYSSPRIRLALEDDGVSTGYLELPPLTNEQMQVAIPTAVAREIPQGLQEIELSTLLVPALQDLKKNGVFYLAFPKNSTDPRSQAFGAQVVQSEPALLSLVRGLKKNGTVQSDEVTAVVQSGFRTTTVLLLKAGHPYFARDFRLAGADFTYAFQMGEQIAWREAEARKLAYDVSMLDFQVESFLKKWLGEIRRSLNFAEGRLPELKPTKVVFTGGSSLWTGLAERLQTFLELPVERQVWKKIRPSDPKASNVSDMAFYDVSLGLVSQE
jgi:Tfp pilus assembly PilM family ATPase